MGVYDGNPCRGCEKPKRHPGCHGKCEDRAAWKTEYDTAKVKIRAEKDRDDAVYDALKRTKKRIAR